MNTSTSGLAFSSQSINLIRYVVHVWCGSESVRLKLRKLGHLVGSECLQTLDSDHMGNYIPFSIAKYASKDSEREQRLRARAAYRTRYGGSWL